MLTFPNAKINLGLNIIQQRDDGFHDIETVFYPIDWCDALEAVPANHFDFEMITPYDSTHIKQEENLCQQAYQLLQDDHNFGPLQFSLLKTIPIGAGLGGGSSNAVFTLKLCQRKGQLSLTDQQLQQYALQLGSDCPFFLENTPVFAQGRGERLTPVQLDLSDYQIAIATPDISVDTGWAYQQITPKSSSHSLQNVIQSSFSDWRDHLINDFEPVIFDQHPQIAQFKEKLYGEGALYASLSGSGSAVFGIFKKNQDLAGLSETLELPEHRLFIQNATHS